MFQIYKIELIISDYIWDNNNLFDILNNNIIRRKKENYLLDI